MHLKMFVIAGLLSSLLIWLPGCATQGIESCPTLPAPPASLLEPCPVTSPPDGDITFWDVYDLAIQRQKDVEQCNATRVEPLRKWIQGIRELGVNQ